MSLNGKTAIITGSSRGIGKAIAMRLAKDGANVVVTYHSSKDKAEEIVEEIKDKGVDAIALQVNVREIESVRDLFSKAVNYFNKVDMWNCLIRIDFKRSQIKQQYANKNENRYYRFGKHWRKHW